MTALAEQQSGSVEYHRPEHVRVEINLDAEAKERLETLTGSIPPDPETIRSVLIDLVRRAHPDNIWFTVKKAGEQ